MQSLTKVTMSCATGRASRDKADRTYLCKEPYAGSDSFEAEDTCSGQGSLTGIDSMQLAQGFDALRALPKFSPQGSGVLLGLL